LIFEGEEVWWTRVQQSSGRFAEQQMIDPVSPMVWVLSALETVWEGAQGSASGMILNV
jgi:hypothetical protein